MAVMVMMVVKTSFDELDKFWVHEYMNSVASLSEQLIFFLMEQNFF